MLPKKTKSRKLFVYTYVLGEILLGSTPWYNFQKGQFCFQHLNKIYTILWTLLYAYIIRVFHRKFVRDYSAVVTTLMIIYFSLVELFLMLSGRKRRALNKIFLIFEQLDQVLHQNNISVKYSKWPFFLLYTITSSLFFTYFLICVYVRDYLIRFTIHLRMLIELTFYISFIIEVKAAYINLSLATKKILSSASFYQNQNLMMVERKFITDLRKVYKVHSRITDVVIEFQSISGKYLGLIVYNIFAAFILSVDEIFYNSNSSNEQFLIMLIKSGTNWMAHLSLLVPLFVHCELTYLSWKRYQQLCYKIQEQFNANSLVRKELENIAFLLKHHQPNIRSFDMVLNRSVIISILQGATPYVILILQHVVGSSSDV